MQYPNYDGMGVYALVDENGKMYIGSSIDCKKRFREHEIAFKNGRENQSLQSAYNKGVVFHGKILEKISYGNTLYFLREREKYYITQYSTLINGYNSTPATGWTKEQDEFVLQAIINEGNKKAAAKMQKKIEKMSMPIMQKSNFRFTIAITHDFYSVIREHAEKQGEKLTPFIVRAITETMERDNQSSSTSKTDKE